jgi:Ca-activated chloride channel family protein
MRTGILDAMASLREGSQRQIVLITDGMIGFESQVVAAIAQRLPASSRVHTVGVGSSVNRSLTGPAARAGHGLEVVIGIGEDPERAVSRLLARTSAPLLVELEVSGSAVIDHAPLKLPDLFAGAPALISVAMRPEGGDLVVRGRTAEGAWQQRLHVAAIDAGSGNQAAIALFGREAVEDLETHLAGGGDAREINATIEQLGVDFQIATRLTSWVAVSRDVTVDPRDALRHERMPQELPYGMSAEGVGLRAPSAPSPHKGAASSGELATRSRSMAMPRSEPMARRPSAAPPPASIAMPKPAMPMSRSMPAPEAEERSALRAPSLGFEDAPEEEESFASGRLEDLAPPRAAKSESAREEGGFLDKVKRVLGFGSDDARDGGAKDRAAPPPPAAPPAPPPPPPRRPSVPAKTIDLRAPLGKARPGKAGRTLRGRVVIHSAVALVIEILVKDHALDWAPGATAQIELSDGTTITATVDLTKTTRPGSIADGASARLALSLPRGTSLIAPIRITIECNGATITVDL